MAIFFLLRYFSQKVQSQCPYSTDEERRRMGNTVCASRVMREIQLLCLQVQKPLFYCSSAGRPLVKRRRTLPGR